ncbi:phosphatidylserine decarboxylase [Flavobacterium psychrophilum]|uniref:Probable Acyl CoA binding protein n=1 Tax=Flavobacterium psychrophilum (strain ATCC 49511 / DSM 21280 / CIP 103535 / JIP02/86) TaxID=402612 RepID=A6GX89_FLAPJ|nr:acyl-CoA-binding protein [Flavobacterium psychrophilum]AIG29511.1 phosphatidylserine decarboxylase [Flavobacterium psychrophilum]AIG31788.1 phosphatidylserine decarboxylase [Flavobacterium psychrophilum]AIG33942.1 phosphatidylserine decarboxylase [Flavobacterium psychrophilum]AIG36305.1 phosphatidylserine decarboxylase [Flavobacterium psychrophilum]AIG38571.1 phosphatidylserine decarboxylase [Flavobacterium psychrophilum]
MFEKDLETQFQEAIHLAQTIAQSSLPQDVQLRCYAYYKQATFGSLGSVNYSNLDVRDAFKNNAWLQISHISVEEAKQSYIDIINKISNK